jgi:uncharacterized protein YigA (DUF484 family)
MGTVIDFENRAVASLRKRVAEVEEANQDLIAFARGHSGAVAAIHSAALAALDAEGLDHLIHIVTQLWPDLLGLDAVALALVVGNTGIRADSEGMQFLDPLLIERSIEITDAVLLRACDKGHPLFGPASELIRAEALVRINGLSPLPSGLLVFGQRRPQGFETRHGSELLVFLASILSRTLARWLLP